MDLKTIQVLSKTSQMAAVGFWPLVIYGEFIDFPWYPAEMLDRLPAANDNTRG